MKTNLFKKVIPILCTLAVLSSISIAVFATDEFYSLRDDFDNEVNAGPTWFYGVIHAGSATHTAGEFELLDSYNSSYYQWVKTEVGYEWGGLGNGNWLPFWNADTVARWVSPKSGSIVISAEDQPAVDGVTGNIDAWSGGNVRFKIMKNDIKIYPTDSEWFVTTTRISDIPDVTTTVQAGDKIDIVLNAGADMVIAGDNLNYYPTINLTPTVVVTPTPVLPTATPIPTEAIVPTDTANPVTADSSMITIISTLVLSAAGALALKNRK